MSRQKKQQQQPLNPKKYVMTRARSLPFYKCLINHDWEKSHMAYIIVMRKHNNGHITAGFYLVDLLALGVKDTHFVFNEPEWSLMEKVPEDIYGEVSYTLVHNIIYGAVAFAEDFNVKPHKDFSITQCLLEEDTEDIDLLDIEFGINGEPAFISSAGNIEYFEEDEEDIPDFSNYTDDDWRAYFQSSPAPDEAEITIVMEGIFETWLNQNMPVDESINHSFDDGIDITYDLLELHPFEDEKDHKEATEIFQSFEKIKRFGLSSLLQRVQKLIDKNPDNPMLYNFLCSILQLQKRNSEYRELCSQVIEKFPDYVHGKILWINILIEDDRIDEIPEFLNHCYDLGSICPSRKIFHISEAENFYATLIRYFVCKGLLRQAKIYTDRILDLMEDERYEQGYSNSFKIAQREFALEKMKHVIGYLTELDIPAHDFLRETHQ